MGSSAEKHRKTVQDGASSDIPIETLRDWFICHMLVTWRKRWSVLLRRADNKHHEGHPDHTIRALREIRPTLKAWISVIDEYIGPQEEGEPTEP